MTVRLYVDGVDIAVSVADPSALIIWRGRYFVRHLYSSIYFEARPVTIQ